MPKPSDLPPILYGTAWKEDDTESLVREAIAAGFRGIDTANQRKHYHEAGVGKAVQAALEAGEVERGDLFLQTKFTFQASQDHRLPYDPEAPFTEQVQQSFASSLEHLGVDSLDSYVLHGPSQGKGLGEADREVWRAMESLQTGGRVGRLGVSNISAGQLDELMEWAEVMPAFVQNRCYARKGWDQGVRRRCDDNGMIYQGFSLLTANEDTLRSEAVKAVAKAHDATVPQVVFAFACAVGMLPLTGTTDREHMRQDLAALELELSDDEVATIRRAEA